MIDMSRWLQLAALLALGIGMILVVGGTLVGSLFVPGTWLIFAGILIFAGDGVMRVVRDSRRSGGP